MAHNLKTILRRKIKSIAKKRAVNIVLRARHTMFLEGSKTSGEFNEIRIKKLTLAIENKLLLTIFKY